MLTHKQKENRKKGIGGSDSSGVLGLSKWKTPYQVYLEKVGEVDIDIDDSIAITRGNKLEPLVRCMFEKRMNCCVAILEEALIHKEHSFIRANLDGIVHENGEDVIVEFKTCSVFRTHEFGDQFTDQIPHDYFLQVQHYMMVTGSKKSYVGVLFVNDQETYPLIDNLLYFAGLEKTGTILLENELDFRIYIINAEPDLHELMIDRYRHFWIDHVSALNPPPFESHGDAKIAQILHIKLDTPTDVVADEKDTFLIDNLKRYQQEEKEIQDKISKTKLALQNKMGTHNRLVDIGNKILCYWRTMTRTELDKQALKSEHEDLYHSLIKKKTFKTFHVNSSEGDKNV